MDSLRHSLTLKFALVILAMVSPLIAISAAAFYSLEQVTTALGEVVEESEEELHPVLEMRVMLLQWCEARGDYLLGIDPDGLRKAQRVSGRIDRAFAELAAAPFAEPGERRHAANAQRDWQTALALSTSRDVPGADAKVDGLIDSAERKLVSIHRVIDVAVVKRRAAAEQTRRQSTILVTTGLVGGVAMVLAAGFLLSSAIIRPLGQLEKGAQALSEGNLSCRVDITGEDEIGRLGRSFNVMAEKLQASHNVIEAAATHDFLTGVFNRRELYARLSEEIARVQRYGGGFAFLMLDLDYLKAINDTSGHLAGDEALRKVAEVVATSVRPVDVIGRYGGDEFAVIMPETSAVEARLAGDRIAHAVCSTTIGGAKGRRIGITVSIGIAVFPGDAGSQDALITASDQALSQAKRDGRNGCSSYAA